VALAHYRAKFWFPTAEIAPNITARVFLHDTNVFAPLYTDATGTVPQPNPTRTDAQGFVDFWAEEGQYWLHIDSEAFEISVGGSGQNATEQWVLAQISAHDADTTDVHGIADTGQLATDTDVAAVTTALQQHTQRTTNVHGIADTSVLETQTGAQAKANAAQQNALAALTAHDADTTDVHGIADTSQLLTQADIDGLATHAEVQAVADSLTAHEVDTTNVHGITDTTQLATRADLDGLATRTDVQAVADDLAAHEAATTDVHGIADTSVLETQAGAQAKANAARDAAIADADGRYLPLTGGTVTGTIRSEDDSPSTAAFSGRLPADAADRWTTSVDGTMQWGPGGTTAPDTTLSRSAAGELSLDGGLTLEGHNLTLVREDGTGAYRLRVTGGGLDFEIGGLDLFFSRFANPDFTGAQNVLIRLESAGTHLVGHTILGSTPYDVIFEFDTAEALATIHGDLTVTGVTTISGYATDAAVQAVADDLAAHEAATTNVHGIADTSQLLTQADIDGLATHAEVQAVADSLTAHEADTTNVHGIADTSVLETQTGAQTKANAARDAAIAQAATDAAGLYLNRTTGGTVQGTITESAASATASAYRTQVSGDAVPRWEVRIDGSARWSNGTDAADVVVARTAAGVLTLTGSLDAVLTAASTIGLGTRVSGDTQDRFSVLADGTLVWGSGTGMPDLQLRRLSAGVLQVDQGFRVQGTTTLAGLLQFLRAASTDVAIASQVSGEGFDRFRLTAAGLMEWGPGTAARDVNLSREAAGTLALHAGGLRVYRATAGEVAFSARVEGDTQSRWYVLADGSMTWGPGGSTVQDIGLGRTAAGILTLTGAALAQVRAATTDAVRDVRVSGDTQPRFYQVATGQMYWGPGNASLDTLLYRDQPGSLVTDGNFTVNGQLFVNGTTETTGTSAATGFTVASQRMRRKAGTTYVNVSLNVTTALTTPGGTSGNVNPDVTMCTVPANWRPGEDLYTSVTTGVGHGTIRIATTGVVQLITWIPSQSVAAGAVMFFTYTFQ